MGAVLEMKREPPIAAIIEQYVMHLSLTEPSKFSERMAFSLWMYENHGQWMKHIEVIWKAMKQK